MCSRWDTNAPIPVSLHDCDHPRTNVFNEVVTGFLRNLICAEYALNGVDADTARELDVPKIVRNGWTSYFKALIRTMGSVRARQIFHQTAVPSTWPKLPQRSLRIAQ
jgi:hypothetical protein